MFENLIYVIIISITVGYIGRYILNKKDLGYN